MIGVSLKIYPLVSHQNGAQNSDYVRANNRVNHWLLPSTAKPAFNTKYRGQNAVAEMPVNQLDSWVLPPKDQRIQQQNAQLVTHFDFALLPILDNQPNVNMAAFWPYQHWLARVWFGQTYFASQPPWTNYLQVYVSDNLIKDELYRQVEATEDLYRYGKVVWGVVIKSDGVNPAYVRRGTRHAFANHRVIVADILFDPSGQG